jgi:hypothetical protein
MHIYLFQCPTQLDICFNLLIFNYSFNRTYWICDSSECSSEI